MKYVETYKPIVDAIYNTSNAPMRKGIWVFINNQIDNVVVRHGMVEIHALVYEVIPINVCQFSSSFISDLVEEMNEL